MLALTELGAAFFSLILTIVSIYCGIKGVMVLFERNATSRLKNIVYGLSLLALFGVGMWAVGRVSENMH